MHIMQARISCSDFDDRAKVTREVWGELCSKVRGLDLPAWEVVDPERVWKDGEYGKWWSAEGLVTVFELQALSDAGLKPSVSRVRGLFSEQHPAAILADAQMFGKGGTVNIDITVPGGVALLSIDEVTWLEDCCTENLQQHLKEGWRIIAVCPPNDTRRPTYVIGRKRPF